MGGVHLPALRRGGIIGVAPGLHLKKREGDLKYNGLFRIHQHHEGVLEMQVNSKVEWLHKRSSFSKLVVCLLQV